MLWIKWNLKYGEVQAKIVIKRVSGHGSQRHLALNLYNREVASRRSGGKRLPDGKGIAWMKCKNVLVC